MTFLKTNVNVLTESIKQNKFEKLNFLLASCQSLTKRAGSRSGSVNRVDGSKDPDPYQNVTNSEHCWIGIDPNSLELQYPGERCLLHFSFKNVN
jgi:hypothetical protein